jgi:hypothetical protein
MFHSNSPLISYSYGFNLFFHNQSSESKYITQAAHNSGISPCELEIQFHHLLTIDLKQILKSIYKLRVNNSSSLNGGVGWEPMYLGYAPRYCGPNKYLVLNSTKFICYYYY